MHDPINNPKEGDKLHALDGSCTAEIVARRVRTYNSYRGTVQRQVDTVYMRLTRNADGKDLGPSWRSTKNLPKEFKA